MRKYLFIIGLSIIAWINAVILSYKAYQFQFLPVAERPLSFCDINAVFSCTQVLAHPASLIFGIPFPMIAFLVYPIIAGIALYGYI